MNPRPEPLESVLELEIGRIAEEFEALCRQGQAPAIEEFVGRYPHLADVLREILPTVQILQMSSVKDADTEKSAGFATSPHAAPGGTGPVLVDGAYEILSELGRGGMGIVFKARQVALDRVVALKMIRAGVAASPDELVRFKREAQTVAQLRHPNIVQVYAVGESAGQPYFSLEYLEAGSLAAKLNGQPQPPRQAAELVETLARAIAAAHQLGLVHRDLKPANVLLAADGTPKITDFGLVKHLADDSTQTQGGVIVGTPSYMAPEQASGQSKNIGPAADIYALGAILYDLLTGRPPFKAATTQETLEQVRLHEPASPLNLQPGCPRDLATICLKCLSKDPARRYASAADLAEDLRRFLANEPIRARPIGVIERIGKWVRRRPAVAASMGLATLAALAVVTLTVRLVYSWELEDANQKLVEAVGAKEAALVAADDARRAAEFNHQQADEARSKLDAALGRERALHYLHSFSLAHRELQAGRIEEARRLLDACPKDLRHWEWHYLYRQCHAELLTLRGITRGYPALAVSHSRGLIAAASVTQSNTPVESKLLVWDAASGKVKLELVGLPDMITRLAISPDGARLAYVSMRPDAKTIHICDVQTGRELYKITGTLSIGQVAFSPDGTQLAAPDRSQIHLYDSADGTKRFTLSGHTGSVNNLAFSANGKRLVSAGTDRLVKLWDLEGRKEVFTSRGHSGAIENVAFSPKGDQIVSCGASVGGGVKGEVRLWSATDGKPAPLAMTFPFPVVAAAFTANPGQIACAGGDGVHFLDVGTGKTVFTLRGHTGEVTRMAATADGTRLVTSGADLTVRVWPVGNPEFMQIPLERPSGTALAFSPDGARLALGDYGTGPGTGPGVRVLPVPPHAEGPRDIRLKNAALPIHALAFFPDNRRLAGADRDGVHLWDLGDEAASRYIAHFGVWEVSISPDGRHLATATRHPDINPRPDFVPEVPVAKAKAGLPILPRPPVPEIKIWRVADGQLEWTLPGQISVSFSPDGRRLAGAKDNNVVVWNAATGAELRTLSGLNEPVLRVRFADGGRLVVGFSHHQAAAWDAETGRTIATTDGLSGPAFVTPDGRRIVGIQGGIKWWDARLGREILRLPVSVTSGRPTPFALSADGRCFATFSGNKLKLWEAGPP